MQHEPRKPRQWWKSTCNTRVLRLKKSNVFQLSCKILNVSTTLFLTSHDTLMFKHVYVHVQLKHVQLVIEVTMYMFILLFQSALHSHYAPLPAHQAMMWGPRGYLDNGEIPTFRGWSFFKKNCSVLAPVTNVMHPTHFDAPHFTGFFSLKKKLSPPPFTTTYFNATSPRPF